jgi:hypothetical protein
LAQVYRILVPEGNDPIQTTAEDQSMKRDPKENQGAVAFVPEEGCWTTLVDTPSLGELELRPEFNNASYRYPAVSVSSSLARLLDWHHGKAW